MHFVSVHIKIQFIAHLFYPLPYILDPEYASEFYSKISQYSKDVIDLPDGVYLENEVLVHEPEVKKPANRSTFIYVENEVPVHEPEVKKPASRSTIIGKF